jgi:polyphosphate kinase 2 (PPK2 family)
MEQINNFEKHIVQNSTIVLKFTCIWVKGAANRLLRRLEEEEHHVKFSAGDLKERWDDYMEYYEEA